MSIFDTDNWKEIGSSLGRNKTRTFLTAFGIFWGTLMLSLLWGAGQGANRMMRSNFAGFAANSAFISDNTTKMPYKGFKKGLWWSLTTEDLASVRRNVPELDVVTPMINRWGVNASYNDKTSSGNLMGLEPNYVEVISPVIKKGRFINDIDVAKADRVCVLGATMAANLFGSKDPLGQTVNVNNLYYRVVGVIAQRTEISIGASLDEAIVMPISTARAAYNNGNRFDFMMVVARPGCKPGDLRPKIFQAIRKNHPIHPDDTNAIYFGDLSEQFAEIDKLLTALEWMVFFVGFSSLLAGVIGVGNIMWVIVKERTKEFGVRRAIGAKPKAILMQILSESAVLTAIAGTAGVAAAVGILQVVTDMLRQSGQLARGVDPNMQLTFSSAVTILLLFMALGMLAGSIPAIKAMKIKPIEALNDK